MSIGWLFGGCSCFDKKNADILRLKLAETQLTSATFDTLITSVDSLPSSYSIKILLEASTKIAIQPEEFQKKEVCLLKAYSIASRKEKKIILQRMIVFYFEEMYHYVPEVEEYALAEGYRRCRELESYHRLSDAEWVDMANRKAEYLRWMNLFEESLTTRFQILNHYQQKNDTQNTINELRAIADFYRIMKDLPKSWEFNRIAYDLSIKKGLENEQFYLLSGLAFDAYNLGLYKNRIALLKKMLTYNKKEHLLSIYFQLGETYTALDSFDIARHYLRIALSMKDEMGKAEKYRRIADTFIAENREDSASHYINLAMVEFDQHNDSLPIKDDLKLHLPYSSLRSCISYARLLEKNRKLEKAIKTLDITYPIIYSPLVKYNQQDAIEALNTYASIYRKTGNYAKAFAAIDLRDSIQEVCINLENEKINNDITNRYKNREFIASIDWEKKQLSYSNKILICSLFIVIILIGASLLLWWIYSLGKKQLALINKKQQEIDVLKNNKNTESKPNQSVEEELFCNLEKLMTENKLFRNPDISLDLLSQSVKVNRIDVSACINSCSGKNFSQWLNTHRITYVIDRLTDSSNLQALLSDAGFSSKASFYRGFKQYTSMSPKQYLEHKNKQIHNTKKIESS